MLEKEWLLQLNGYFLAKAFWCKKINYSPHWQITPSKFYWQINPSILLITGSTIHVGKFSLTNPSTNAMQNILFALMKIFNVWIKLLHFSQIQVQFYFFHLLRTKLSSHYKFREWSDYLPPKKSSHKMSWFYFLLLLDQIIMWFFDWVSSVLLPGMGIELKRKPFFLFWANLPRKNLT